MLQGGRGRVEYVPFCHKANSGPVERAFVGFAETWSIPVPRIFQLREIYAACLQLVLCAVPLALVIRGGDGRLGDPVWQYQPQRCSEFAGVAAAEPPALPPTLVGFLKAEENDSLISSISDQPACGSGEHIGIQVNRELRADDPPSLLNSSLQNSGLSRTNGPY